MNQNLMQDLFGKLENDPMLSLSIDKKSNTFSFTKRGKVVEFGHLPSSSLRPDQTLIVEQKAEVIVDRIGRKSPKKSNLLCTLDDCVADNEIQRLLIDNVPSVVQSGKETYLEVVVGRSHYYFSNNKTFLYGEVAEPNGFDKNGQVTSWKTRMITGIEEKS